MERHLKSKYQILNSNLKKGLQPHLCSCNHGTSQNTDIDPCLLCSIYNHQDHKYKQTLCKLKISSCLIYKISVRFDQCLLSKHHEQTNINFSKKHEESNFIRNLSLVPPCVIGLPIAGDRNKLQQELDTRKFEKDFSWFPIQLCWAIFYQKLHHFHNLFMSIRTCL